MQTMEATERPSPIKGPVFWTPPSEVDAWNIALPGDDLFNADATQEPSTLPNQGYIPKYHDDIKCIDSPRVYVSCSPSAGKPGPQSRRVILDDLPSDVTTPQVLRSIRCFGGVISAVLTNSLKKANPRTKTAIIEFVYPEAAADVVSHFHSKKTVFLDSKGGEHQPEVYMIPTPSYFHTEANHCLLDRGCTRALFIPSFPEEAIWCLLCTIGTKHVNIVQLSEGHLTIELTSLFAADRAEKQIRSGDAALGYDATEQGMCYIPDSSQGVMQDNYDSHNGFIAFADADILQTTWDREPYNRCRTQPLHGTPTAKDAIGHPPKPTHEEILAEYFSVDPSEIWSYLEDRRSFQDTTYNIVGSTIKLTRHKWSWSISAEDDLKLLMANTLHDPDWATEWDEYFKARGMVNLRTWEEYGLLAKHRRERAAEQGLAKGTVPICDECSWGCGHLKNVPVSRLIRDYSVCKGVNSEGK
ncbi:hypothetical protein MAC_03950 [Metarhizium acridum CQMa 102]|uniref:Nucleotide-binding, alpha-beta plait n=1 Tax=Metarhizium acridum (strain CQMa 102) TaxID=655827 RepID=E9E252_METAQ|nr:uncharacterized protein MAC_03950 [Metarhizium acridum CQMa 102]EFY89968.1 hypothetical protein MAC_03950 [Metarhizium acridum CQMa 102]